MKETVKAHVGEAALLLTALIWGSGFVASAVSLRHFTPYEILFGRFLIGAVLLSAVFHRKIRCIRKSTLKKGAVLGFFLYGAFLLQTVGLQYTTPSKNAFLTAVNVIIVPFISFVIYKRKFDKYEVFGALLAVLGVAVISLEMSFGIQLGDALTLLCAVFFAFQIFYTSLYVAEEDPVLLTLVQMMVAALLAAVPLLFQERVHLPQNGEALFSLFYLGIFSTTAAYLLQTTAQKFTTETKTAIILSTEAFFGMALSVLILSEPLTLRMILGGILIFAAILTSETKGDFGRMRKKYPESLEKDTP